MEASSVVRARKADSCLTNPGERAPLRASGTPSREFDLVLIVRVRRRILPLIPRFCLMTGQGKSAYLASLKSEMKLFSAIVASPPS